MQCYPNNTVAKYTTKLPNVIDLNGNWEVGLTEISCPGSLCNVRRNECTFMLIHKTDSTQNKAYKVQPGYYENARHLVRALNELVFISKEIKRYYQNLRGRELIELVHFSYSEHDELVEIIIHEQYSIIFNETLARKLGFDNTSHCGHAYADNTMEIDLNIRSLYVYCDLLEPVIVGDTKTPLLRIVNMKETRNGANLHVTLNPITYLPVLQKHFDTVEINIMDDTGKPVPFNDGKSFIVLDFRRTVHSYFTIM